MNSAPRRFVPRSAVFLSYASQDIEAARRICRALRAADIEVWFDQSELRGGDVWDAKIRKQIKDCALFLPIISAHAQARREGYFRLEWRLADQRTHLMGKTAAFIVPVCIDDTPDSDADVPNSFLNVQWTRFPGGEIPVGFVEHIRLLLGCGGPQFTPPPFAMSTNPMQVAPPPATPNAQVPAGAPKSGRWFPFILAGAVAVVGLTVWSTTKPPAAPSLAAPGPSVERSASPGAPAMSEPKSIAVLAFENRSDDRSADYFSDGISEELATLLGRVPGLLVAGSTSAFAFKGKSESIPEIARKLGVAYVVEGTVRKAGNTLRITAKLIKAADGFQVWSSGNLDREHKDILALQAEIAEVIAKNLSLTLGVDSQPARAVNPEAHQLVLEGRHFWRQRGAENLAQAETRYLRALELDPQFAQARAGLADVWMVRGWYREMDGKPGVAEDLARAKTEAQLAREQDPTLAEPYACLGTILFIEGKLADSEQQFARAFALNPNYAVAHHWHSVLFSVIGRFDLAVEEIEQSVSLDPLSPNALWSLAINLFVAQPARALKAAERSLALRSGFVPVLCEKTISAWASGEKEKAVAAAREIAQGMTKEPRWWADSEAIYVLRQAGLASEAQAHTERVIAATGPTDYRRFFALAAMGRAEEAFALPAVVPTMALARVAVSPIWDDLRADPRLLQLMAKHGYTREYKVGRDTVTRMRKEAAAKK